MCEMLDMTIYGLETETTHPKRLFDNLLFLDFRKNEKKLGGIYYCFLAKMSIFWLKINSYRRDANMNFFK